MNDRSIKAGHSLTSWIDIPEDSDFSLYNIPFGIFKTNGRPPTCCTAIGEYVVDLSVLGEHGYFKTIPITHKIFHNEYLNEFIALGKENTKKVRERLIADWHAGACD